MWCSMCGAPAQATHAFCGQCGSHLSKSMGVGKHQAATTVNLDAATSTRCLRVYSPIAIGVYTLITFPIGLSLHGLNAYRRGQLLRSASWIAGALTFTVFAVQSTSAVIGTPSMLSTLYAVALWREEDECWRRDLASGARTARWWPPMLAGILGLFGLALLFAPG